MNVDVLKVLIVELQLAVLHALWSSGPEADHAYAVQFAFFGSCIVQKP
jgi:hypothetical protein